MSWVKELARPEIAALNPYEHASWDPRLTRLHANELPWRGVDDGSLAGLNRYPEPQARALLERLGQVYGAAADSVLICRGSDEAIDLLVRAFCRPGQDAVLVCPPTFGMYAVAAGIQGASVVSMPLLADQGFALDTRTVIQRCGPEVKLLFLCSPNNPTGNCLADSAILEVADAFAGRALVVVDEAYIEFAQKRSLTAEIACRSQLVVLRTLSKAHGLAGARLGALIANPEVVSVLRKIIAPYAVPQLVLEAVTELLNPMHIRNLPKRMAQIREERMRVQHALLKLPDIKAVLPSDANFLLARFKDPAVALARAVAAQILVRDARGYVGLGDALRVSIGTRQENDQLLQAWA